MPGRGRAPDVGYAACLCGGQPRHSPGAAVRWEEDYIRVDRAARMALGKLFAHERDKIRRALGKLREHLVAAGLSVGQRARRSAA